MWEKESVMYQIYPLGFCGAPQENDGKTVNRIRKVLAWADYLKELGADTVLFNPVFQSDRHGYDTRDYAQIDCRLGTNADFKEVCEGLRKCGIKVILDGVFNHAGRGFRAFSDVVKNRERSAYRDWFFINFSQNNSYNDGFSYEGWEGHYELVKLNLRNPDVTGYLLNCVRSWIDEFNIDGLRLDVAYCVDKDFLRTLRGFCDGIKPDFLLIGEMLFGDYKQIVNDAMLQSCTNYECYKGIFSSLNDLNLFEISYSLNRQFGPWPHALYQGLHLVSFADNHDVSRLASILKDKRHIPLAYGILFGMPGIPCLYYGSEWGIEGGKQSGDSALRPPVDKPCQNELYEFIKKLIAVRKRSKALCRGGYKNITVLNRQLVFERALDGESVLIAINAHSEQAALNLNLGNLNALDLLSDTETLLENQITLPPYSVAYWKII